MKTDILMARRVEYHYDLENPALYGSKNNRLMYHETFETQSETKLSTTWYYYTMAGNVRRIVTLDEDSVGRVVDLPEHREHPAGDVASGFIPGADQSRDREGAVKEHPARPGSLRSSGEVAGAGNTTGPYTSIRFEYPCNGEPVQYVAGEDWLLDPDVNDGNPIQVRVNWAREFRYDAARLRYMNRTLNGGHFKNSNVVDE